MARKKTNQDLSFMKPSLNKSITQKIQDDLDTAYKNTYYTDNDDAKFIDAIKRKMEHDLNNLIDRTRLRNSGNSISNLYARTLATSEDDDTLKEFKHALQDESMLSDLMDMYSQNAVQRDLDREIDVVCKYVPKLHKALDLKKKYVLSADHFKKDNIQINIITNETAKNEPDSSNDTGAQNAIKSDIESFKKKYKLLTLAKNTYWKTSKYGEDFIYIVPYNKALKRLVRKAANNTTGLLTEGSVLTESQFNTIVESSCRKLTFAYNNTFTENTQSISSVDNILNEGCYFYDEINPSTINMLDNNSSYDKIEVEFNDLGVIPSVIKERQEADRVINALNVIHEADGLYPAKVNLSNASYLNNFNKEARKFASEGGSFKTPEKLDVDGFTEIRNKKKKDEEEINIPGCIVRSLDHTMVKKLVVDKTVLGYYYIETNRNIMENNQTTFSSTLGGLRPRRSTRDRENMERPAMDDQVLEKIARQIAQKIDAKFINANQDLAQEIYSILKYNADHGNGKVSKIRVSFIPPEDIVHCYFKENEKTHRGISDLSLSLFPAKLLSCLYISNTIGILTRGYDKRAYYVRQSVDTNIQAVLLNVINQIKQSNFNLRQIENMNNILNITGRFNDLVIPQGPNGENPVSFEIIPGQNIEPKTELMRMLEETAVGLTGVTMEMIETQENSQTATYVTMTNARLLIDIFERQDMFQDLLSEIFTKIYQIEYGVEDELEVNLPPPVMLNFTNTSQILTVANELIQNILTMKLGMENPQDEAGMELRTVYAGKLMQYYFKDFLPMEDIEKLFDESKIELSSRKGNMQNQQQQQQQQQQGGY